MVRRGRRRSLATRPGGCVRCGGGLGASFPAEGATPLALCERGDGRAPPRRRPPRFTYFFCPFGGGPPVQSSTAELTLGWSMTPTNHCLSVSGASLTPLGTSTRCRSRQATSSAGVGPGSVPLRSLPPPVFPPPVSAAPAHASSAACTTGSSGERCPSHCFTAAGSSLGTCTPCEARQEMKVAKPSPD